MRLKKFEKKLSVIIKKLRTHFQEKDKLFMAIVLTGISTLALLLFFEYRFFSYQADKLLKLKRQYRTYVSVLREAAHKYGMLPEQFDDDLQSCNESLFPSGARVFSSDDPEEEWVFINREDEHLKQSSLSYLKEQQLESAIKRLRGDEWFDYPDAFMQPVQQTQAKKRVPTRSTACVSRAIKKRIKDMNFAWPINHSRFWLSSFFGPRKKPNGSWSFHRGIDMAALSGTPVKAAAPGKIIEARYASGYGNTVVVMHNNKYKTRYAHLKSFAVKVGQQISRGTLIGLVGDTGLVRKSGKDASHLHFEVYAYGKQINPLYCLG